MRFWARRLLAIIALLAITPAPAVAKPKADTLAGEWRITSERHPRTGCQVTGTAKLTARGDGAYEARLITRDMCTNEAKDVASAEQRCMVTRANAAIEVRCAIVRIISGSYVADQFKLQITAPDRVIGGLSDGAFWANNAVTWRRAPNALVS
jgi:hypothetical protein